jgi:hypothetical protein
MSGDTPMIVYVTNATGSWQWRRFGFAAPYGRPAIALDAAGSPHFAFTCEFLASSVCYTLMEGPDSWATTGLTRSQADGNPSIAVNASGTVLVAVPRGYWAANPGVVLVTYDGTSFVQTMVSARTDIEAVSMDLTGDGQVRMVLQQAWAGLRLLEETAAAAAAEASRTAGAAGAAKAADAPGSSLVDPSVNTMTASGESVHVQAGASVPAVSRAGGGEGGASH